MPGWQSGYASGCRPENMSSILIPGFLLTVQMSMKSEKFLRTRTMTPEEKAILVSIGSAAIDESLLGGTYRTTATAGPGEAASLPPAAVWVVGFTSSLNDQKMEKAVLEIRKSAQDICHSIRRH